MEVQINKEFLRRQRELRAWTQSHLADAANLSLRTVQRIESSGTASQESAMALASVLNLSLTELASLDKLSSPKSFWSRRWRYGLAVLSLFSGVGFWSWAEAKPVMIKLAVATDAESRGEMQLSNELGNQSEVKFDQEFRLIITTAKKDGHLLITTDVYDFVQGEYQLISSPAILVADNQTSSIRLNTPSHRLLEFSFTPDF